MLNKILHNSQKLIVLSSLILLIGAGTQEAFSEQVAKFYYKGVPEKLDGKDLKVPLNTVAMSDTVRISSPTTIIKNEMRKASIMFVIDHSGSMCVGTGTQSPAQDPKGNRFVVTRALLDTLKKYFTELEVGVVVFRQYLFFNVNDHSLFMPTPEWGDSGSFMRLLKIDSTYNYKFQGQQKKATGYDVLRELLETQDDFQDTLISKTLRWTELKYRPSPLPRPNPTGTNINSSFDAVRTAFKPENTMIDDKNSHFVIFLSDGEATYPRTGQNQYQQGINVPTTFTIFFTQNSQPPLSLRTMTTNIQRNGYSPISNPKSNLWPYNNTSADSLMSFVMANIISIIKEVSAGPPTKVIINNKEPNSQIWMDKKNMSFDGLFPLLGESTEFKYQLWYKLKDAEGKDTKDTSYTITFDAVLSAPPQSDSLAIARWDRTIKYFVNNIELVGKIADAPRALEMRFIESKVDWLYNYKEASIALTTSKGAVVDQENFKLEKKNNYFTKMFNVNYIADEQDPVPGNNVLECKVEDVLVAQFKNPLLPLDTLTVRMPINGEIPPELVLLHRENSPANRKNLKDNAQGYSIGAVTLSKWNVDYLRKLNMYDNNKYYGVLIQAMPDSADKILTPLRIEMKFTIYDPVGNTIFKVESENVGYDEKKKIASFIWPMTNKEDRLVGEGAYKVVMTAKAFPKDKGKEPLQTKTFKYLIGVKSK
ncbi:MAG: hypothetical protein JW795_18015 [Chitinivibrionales bacterium]|nr:hypothetical protein [Chitinivibrionales bacterium]